VPVVDVDHSTVGAGAGRLQRDNIEQTILSVPDAGSSSIRSLTTRSSQRAS
jgi:hypothetical protein